MSRINATAFGLATGISFALFSFIIVLLATYASYGTAFVEMIGTVYLGVEATLLGAFIALPWAFVDFFIGGFVIAWLYNRFAD